MFWDSVKKTRFVPIVTLVVLLLTTLLEFVFDYINGYYDWNQKRYGHFWDSILDGILLAVPVIVIFGIISGTVLFRFVQSKKQVNVIFSLGLSRRKIFLAKYLGGIVPLAAVLAFSATVEVLADIISGCIVKFPTIHLALISVAGILGTYTFAFTVAAVSMAFSGNIVESGIFSVILAIFPNFSGIFFGHMRSIFTHGGVEAYGKDWNFFSPFSALLIVQTGEGYRKNYLLRILYTSGKLTATDWSGTITCFVLSAIIFAIAYWAFPKRKNETSGYFGKAKGLNEICGAMTGFYIGTIVSLNLTENHSAIIAFVSFILTFILVYLVFKFLFTYKRMKNMKQSVKRIAAYVAAFALIAVIFSTGLFGYSSYVPNAKKVESIEISLEISNPYDIINYSTDIHGDEVYGYSPMISNGFSNQVELSDVIFWGGTANFGSFYLDCTVEKDNEIKKVIDIHKAIAKEGKIKANADNACGYGIMISYKLSNGRTVDRRYSTVSTESAMKMLGLSDLEGFKDEISEYFYYHSQSMEKLGPSDYLDGFCLLSKNLKSCKYVDGLKYDFMEAILADLERQSAQQIYFHNPEDELGVIYFPLNDSVSSILSLRDNEIIGSDGVIINADTNEITGTVKERRAGFPDLPDTSISISGDKCIVVTKDMTNIVKYLTDHNLMQYFKSDITANDVNKIKIATRAETVDKKNSEMLPLFAAGYACADEVKSNDTMSRQASHDFANHVGGSIKDKATIQTVLDNTLLYGFNDNSDRIVEVTYNDGSIATYALKADVYNKLNIK